MPRTVLIWYLPNWSDVLVTSKPTTHLCCREDRLVSQIATASTLRTEAVPVARCHEAILYMDAQSLANDNKPCLYVWFCDDMDTSGFKPGDNSNKQ